MKILAPVLILLVLAVALPSAPSAEEYAVHTFKCPPTTTFKANWKNKIETQPTDFPLSPSYENLTHSASFKESAVNVGANTVQCLYVLSGTAIQAPYIYKVHRPIVGCTGQPGPTIECRLKPN